MRIPMPPPLQRDMYAGWDSGGSKPQKMLKIANIDKLVGAVTGPVSTGWVCVNVKEYEHSYDMTFNSLHPNSKITMFVKVGRQKQNWNVRGTEYIVEIRQFIAGEKGSNSYSHSTPTAYGIGEHLLLRPKTFTSWLDNRLTAKRIDVEKELWKQLPWYQKFNQKVKEYINSI